MLMYVRNCLTAYAEWMQEGANHVHPQALYSCSELEITVPLQDSTLVYFIVCAGGRCCRSGRIRSMPNLSYLTGLRYGLLMECSWRSAWKGVTQELQRPSVNSYNKVSMYLAALRLDLLFARDKVLQLRA
jgi:hypothetical protein